MDVLIVKENGIIIMVMFKLGLWCLTPLSTKGIGVSGENHRPVASHLQTLSHNVVSSTPRHEPGSNSQR